MLFKGYFPGLRFTGGSDGKESTCNAGDLNSIPGSGRSSRHGNEHPLQYFCLENSMDRGPSFFSNAFFPPSTLSVYVRCEYTKFQIMHHSFLCCWSKSMNTEVKCVSDFSALTACFVNIMTFFCPLTHWKTSDKLPKLFASVSSSLKLVRY